MSSTATYFDLDDLEHELLLRLLRDNLYPVDPSTSLVGNGLRQDPKKLLSPPKTPTGLMIQASQSTHSNEMNYAEYLGHDMGLRK